ncbi:MAG TPA: DUF4870 domain-containing protein [Actinomycetes bacterium]|jgi:uncharacterized Tic20 family protein|nr:DUF4870 domain-containing protein [Actinomycetes bacterium]
MSQQVPPPPPSAGPPGAGPPAQPLPPDQERLWAMLSHLLSFVAAYIALGFLAPLTILLVFGPRSAYVREHAVESLNFNLTWLLYGIVAAFLAILLIGIPILIALGIAYVILVIIASIRANNGQLYRYPLTVRFVK